MANEHSFGNEVLCERREGPAKCRCQPTNRHWRLPGARAKAVLKYSRLARSVLLALHDSKRACHNFPWQHDPTSLCARRLPVWELLLLILSVKNSVVVSSWQKASMATWFSDERTEYTTPTANKSRCSGAQAPRRPHEPMTPEAPVPSSARSLDEPRAKATVNLFVHYSNWLDEDERRDERRR